MSDHGALDLPGGRSFGRRQYDDPAALAARVAVVEHAHFAMGVAQCSPRQLALLPVLLRDAERDRDSGAERRRTTRWNAERVSIAVGILASVEAVVITLLHLGVLH